MAELNFPSMFDTRQAISRQMQDDAMLAGSNLTDSLGGGMMYASSLMGDLSNQGLMGMASMFGGGDPRMQQQNALDEIMARFPNPQTPEDFVEISNALSGVGLHNYAEKAMEMANEIRSSMPTPAYTTVKVGDTDEKGNRITKTILYKDGQPFKELGSQPTDAPTSGGSKPTSYQEYALTTEDPSTAGYAEWMKNQKAGDDDEPNYILDDFIQTSYDTLLEENPNMDKKDLLNQAHVAGQKLFDEYETALEIAREGGNFLNQIESLQSVINPDTLEGKPLYDATHPNGRYFTEAEAVEEARHNIRLSEDQVYSQLVDKTNLENTNTYHLASTQSADTARTNLRDFKEMLQLLQMGASTGFSQDFKDDWRSLFLSLGFTDKDLAVNEVLRTKMKKLALDRLSALKGAASDKDIEFVEAAGAQMNKSELANKVILEIAQVYAQDEIDLYYQMNGWLDKYKSEHNGRYPALNTYKAQEKIFIDSKKPISERIGVTMEQLLEIEPDWEYTDTSADMANNTFLLEGLIKKYGVK